VGDLPSQLPIEAPVHVGDIVAGKYRVDRVLGQGAMGVVVAATHEQLDQRVALKFLLPEVAAHPEIVARFTREARASVRIHSEHVARVLDVGKLETGAPYMVMEYLEGEDLSQILTRRGPLPVKESVGFVIEACEAVAEAHSLGMVHRDLKPANLFLANRPSGKPVIKVLDFGISKIPTTERDKVITHSATIMGSPAYMSPEQMMSADKADVRSDIWSLGVVLYELLGQKLPFPGDSMAELVASILQKTHEPLAAVRTDIPPELLVAIDTCLEKAPERRYQNVALFARAIARFGPTRNAQSVERIEHLLGIDSGPASASIPPPAASSQPIVTVAAGTQTFAAAATVSAVTTLPTPRRSPLPMLGVGVLLIGTIVGVLAFRSAHTNAPPRVASPSTSVASAAAVAPSTLTPEPPTSPSAMTIAPPDDSVFEIPDDPTTTTSTGSATHHHHHTLPASSSSSSAAPAASGSAPTCHVVGYFDAAGNKHFRQECP
jgi:serine/threonine-protein kinase